LQGRFKQASALRWPLPAFDDLVLQPGSQKLWLDWAIEPSGSRCQDSFHSGLGLRCGDDGPEKSGS